MYLLCSVARRPIICNLIASCVSGAYEKRWQCHLSNRPFEFQFIPWLKLYYVLAHLSCWVAFNDLRRVDRSAEVAASCFCELRFESRHKEILSHYSAEFLYLKAGLECQWSKLTKSTYPFWSPKFSGVYLHQGKGLWFQSSNLKSKAWNMRDVKVLVMLSNNTHSEDSRSDDRLFGSILFLISKRSPAKLQRLSRASAWLRRQLARYTSRSDYRRQALYSRW